VYSVALGEARKRDIIFLVVETQLEYFNFVVDLDFNFQFGTNFAKVFSLGYPYP
jgi:hypothetical protein